MTIRAELLKPFRGVPAGTPVTIADEDEFRVLEEAGVARRVETPLPVPELVATSSLLVSVCADKIFDSPAIYPGDCFGVAPEKAAELVERKAVHYTTPEDLVRFYDANRGLEKKSAGYRLL